jgi:hypothetical protein
MISLVKILRRSLSRSENCSSHYPRHDRQHCYEDSLAADRTSALDPYSLASATTAVTEHSLTIR